MVGRSPVVVGKNDYALAPAYNIGLAGDESCSGRPRGPSVTKKELESRGDKYSRRGPGGWGFYSDRLTGLNGNNRVESWRRRSHGWPGAELRPNRVARSLRLRHNRVWALVISDIRTGPFFADFVRGVEDGAHEADYPMFLCNADEDPSKEAGIFNWP